MSPITTPFSKTTTSDEVLDGVDLTARRIIVTGATSGIGVETARSLARAGAEVTLAVRRTDAGEHVAEGIRLTTGNPRVYVRQLDLADHASVREFAAAWKGPLHVLVNNAGIMALPQLERTAEGWELQLATNVLGHFTLTNGLYGAMASAGSARIVFVSSSANTLAPMIFDDPNFHFLTYDPWVAYGQSKTAAALLAVEADRRWSGHGIRANALNPGAIPTGLQAASGLVVRADIAQTPQQGAATSVLLAGSPLVEGIGGRYFEDCSQAAVVSARPTDGYYGVAPYALDPENARRLWALAGSLTAASSTDHEHACSTD
jgi:NAD(P)-dependent dehydrogenase (short-subunit alcohol dehydrogenase family)